MHTLFISDIHLEPNQPHITELFLTFLQDYAPKAQAVYILGDLFEVWLGDDDNNAFNQQIKDAIQALVDQNVHVYFMCGNRDFLIGEQFARETGCILLPDPAVINLYGTVTLLTHGDCLCTFDKKHQWFRRVSQSTSIKTLFLSIPLAIRQKIARFFRNQSKQHNRTAKNYILDVAQNTVEKLMHEYQVTQIIHGHTHQPNIHLFQINGENRQRIVLGAWHEEGSYLFYDSANGAKLEILK